MFKIKNSRTTTQRDDAIVWQSSSLVDILFRKLRFPISNLSTLFVDLTRGLVNTTSGVFPLPFPSRGNGSWIGRRFKLQLRKGNLVCSLIALLASAVLSENTKAEATIHWENEIPESIYPIRDSSGTPIFLLELYSLTLEEDFRIANFLGFNAVIGSGDQVFSLAEKYGFRVTQANWFSKGFDQAELLKNIEKLKGHSSLVAVNLNDEPDYRIHTSGPAVLDRAAQLIREAFLDGKLSVTLGGMGRARLYWPEFIKTVDIIRVDPYPLIEKKPLSLVTELINAARNSARKKKPIISILQAWTWGTESLPTELQIKQMAWQSLIAGANGLSYYDWNYQIWANQPGFVKGILDVNALIKSDLAPFLTEGKYYKTKKNDDVAASLWVLPNNRWRFLSTRLSNDASGSIKVVVKIPSSLLQNPQNQLWKYDVLTLKSSGPFPIGKGGEVTFELDHLGSLILSSEPILEERSACFLTTQKEKISIKKGQQLYTTDLAGRLMKQVQADKSHEFWLHPHSFYKIIDEGKEPFTRAKISIDVKGDLGDARNKTLNSAGPTFPMFPFTNLRQTISLSSSLAKNFRIHPLSWQQETQVIQGESLTEIVELRPLQVAENGLKTWEVNVHLLSGKEWSDHRDHLFYYEVLYELDEIPYKEKRVIRYRIEEPFSFKWDWIQNNTGKITLNFKYSEQYYTFAPEELSFSCYGDGITFEKQENEDKREYLFILSTNGSSPKQKPSRITCELYLEKKKLASKIVTNFLNQNGSIIAPLPKKKAEIHVLSKPLSMQGDWHLLWDTTHAIQPMTNFFTDSQRMFADRQCKVWLAMYENSLYWFMEKDGSQKVRAETVSENTDYLGDDVMELWLQSELENGGHLLATNAFGIVTHKYYNKGKTFPAKKVENLRNHRQVNKWQLVMEIPIHALEWTPDQLREKFIKLNVSAAYSIAPRKRIWWNHPESQKDFQKALVPVVFQKWRSGEME